MPVLSVAAQHILNTAHTVELRCGASLSADCSYNPGWCRSVPNLSEIEQCVQFHHVTDDTLWRFKVIGQSSMSRGQRSTSQRNVTYQQQNVRRQRIGWASSNLARATKLKRIGYTQPTNLLESSINLHSGRSTTDLLLPLCHWIFLSPL